MALSARAEISQPRLSSLELGQGPFRDQLKLRLARVLGLSVDELFPFTHDGHGTAA
jgi:hypothetical protein